VGIDLTVLVMALLIAILLASAEWLWEKKLLWIGLPTIWIAFHSAFLVDQDWQVGGMLLGGMDGDAMNGQVLDSWAEEELVKTGKLPNWCPYYFAGMPAQGSLLIGGPQTAGQKVQKLLSGAGPHLGIEQMRPIIVERSLWGVLKFSWLSARNFLSLLLGLILLPLGVI